MWHNNFLEKYNKIFGVNIKEYSNQVRNIFLQYDWPGNVRELENVVERAINFTRGSIGGVELPLYLQDREDAEIAAGQALVAKGCCMNGERMRKTRQSLLLWSRQAAIRPRPLNYLVLAALRSTLKSRGREL